jgi:hypothetical protein
MVQICLYIGPSLSPDETLVLLVQAGQYDTAFSIAKAFGLPLTSIFDGLAARYEVTPAVTLD